jgi:hypothetical protein
VKKLLPDDAELQCAASDRNMQAGSNLVLRGPIETSAFIRHVDYSRDALSVLTVNSLGKDPYSPR